jgi:acetyltransferase-like isoleucine patch superfamily enzyme
MTKRHVELPEPARAGRDSFVEEVDDRFSGSEDDYEVVTEVLVDLNGDRDAYETWKSGGTVSSVERARLSNYDPHNATLEAEYYADKDDEKFYESKPIQWLWRQFDNTPLADNVEFGIAFRQMLAGHLFEEAGDDLRIFKGVTMSYGHNITVGDNTVIHNDVHLDDRGRLTIGSRTSLSDGAHLYSHSHDVVDQTEVTNYHTIVEDDVRVTHDAIVQSGVRIGRNAMIGARSIVRSDVPAHHVAVGSPAKSVKIKPGWESVAEPLEDANVDRTEERIIEDRLDLDEDERFDEFQRDLSPPER